MPDRELERINIGLRDPQQRRKWWRVREAVAKKQGVEPENLTRPEVFDEIAADFLRLHRLRRDRRVREARQAVARDHGVDPEELSLANLLKITAGAYAGYAQTSDWQEPAET